MFPAAGCGGAAIASFSCQKPLEKNKTLVFALSSRGDQNNKYTLNDYQERWNLIYWPASRLDFYEIRGDNALTQTNNNSQHLPDSLEEFLLPPIPISHKFYWALSCITLQTLICKLYGQLAQVPSMIIKIFKLLALAQTHAWLLNKLPAVFLPGVYHRIVRARAIFFNRVIPCPV